MGSSLFSPDKSDVRHDKYLKLVAIAGLVIVFDQISKAVIRSTLTLYHSITVIPGFFNITHILNPGGAFGFMANKSPFLRNLLFILLSSLAVCLIFYLYKNTPKRYSLLSTCFSLILGGALAAYLGFEEIKDKKTTETFDEKSELKDQVESLQKEIKEMKETKKTPTAKGKKES